MQELEYPQENVQKEKKEIFNRKRRSSSLATECSPLRESNGLFGKEEDSALDYEEDKISFFGMKRRKNKEEKFSIFKDPPEEENIDEVTFNKTEKQKPLKGKENKKTDFTTIKPFDFYRPQRPLLELSIRNEPHKESSDTKEIKETEKKNLKKTLITKLNTISSFANEMIMEAQEYEQKINTLENELEETRKKISEKEIQYNRLLKLCKTAKDDLSAQREVMSGFISKTTENTILLQKTENDLQTLKKNMKETEEKISSLKTETTSLQETLKKQKEKFSGEKNVLYEKNNQLEKKLLEKTLELQKREDFLCQFFFLQTEITKSTKKPKGPNEFEIEIKQELFLMEKNGKEKEKENKNLVFLLKEKENCLEEAKVLIKEKESQCLSYEKKKAYLEDKICQNHDEIKRVNFLLNEEKNKTKNKEEMLQQLTIKKEKEAKNLFLEIENKNKEIKKINEETEKKDIQNKKTNELLKKKIEDGNIRLLQMTKEMEKEKDSIQELKKKEEANRTELKVKIEENKKQFEEETEKYSKEKENLKKEIESLLEKHKIDKQIAETQLEEQKRKLFAIIQTEKANAQQERMELENQLEECKKQNFLLLKKETELQEKKQKTKRELIKTKKRKGPSCEPADSDIWDAFQEF